MSDINLNLFEHSDYHTLLNNVSSSTTSLIYKKINPYNPNILEDIELLDENYSDPRFTRARYEGSKNTSVYYNYYTTSSVIKKTPIDTLIWDGDNSYGKKAAIDYNVAKFAFSNDIVSKSLNFYDKTTINIKYLIDASGSITELSTANKNLFEVQNMYKKGDKVTVSLMDKYNPTNQSTLDGEKTIFEGGFSFSPLIYRELDEEMVFTYDTPLKTSINRLGARMVNLSSYVWETRTDANQDFQMIPSSTNDITFTINGTPTYSQRFSYEKVDSNTWPYGRMALTDYLEGDYEDYEGTLRKIGKHDTEADNPCYYSLDWFLPEGTTQAQGGYKSNNMDGKITVVKDSTGNYTYITAPLTSTYTVNVDLPIKVKATNYETGGERGQEKGPAIVKIVGVLEVQKPGSSNWEYLDFSNPSSPVPYGYTEFKATNIPIAEGGRQATGTTRALVDEKNSFLYFPENTTGGTYRNRYISPFFEGRCRIENRLVSLKKDEKLRIRFFFAEVTTFFRRSEAIRFEIPVGDSSKCFFEVYDYKNSEVSLTTTDTVPAETAIFNIDSDGQTLIFNNQMSLLYNNATFEPQDLTNPNAVSNLYSFVDNTFSFKRYDMIRFTNFFSLSPEYYYIIDIKKPVITTIGENRVVSQPLMITLNKIISPGIISTKHFAFFRKVPDETSVMIDFRKKEGLTSNALILPFNLDSNITKNVANIIEPIKGTLLAKVLLIG